MVSQLNGQVIDKIDKHISYLIEISKAPLYDNDLMYSLEYDQSLTVAVQKQIESFALSTVFANRDIFSFIFFDLEGRSFGKMKQGALYKNYNIKWKPWYQDIIRDRSKAAVLPPHPIPTLIEHKEKDIMVFSVVRQLYSVNLGSPVASIMISSKLDYLRKLCNDIKINNQHRVLLLKDNEIIFDTDVGRTGTIFSRDKYGLTKTDSEKTNSYNIDIDNRRMLVSYQKSDLTEWEIVSIIPSASISEDVKNIRNDILTINIIAGLIVVFLIIIIANRITFPLKKMVTLMKKVEHGNRDVLFNARSRDEIGELGRGFNQMMEEISYLIDRVYRVELNNKEAELKVLQSQINPHFIYNTLETIRMMAEINDDIETAEMVQVLGELLRYTVRNTNRKVKLQDEINHLKNYFFLHKIRFDDRLEFEINIEKELYFCEIIKLLLQPIVENAIYYGLEDKNDQVKISIHGYSLDDGMIIDIKDNGIGMNEEIVDKLCKKINSFNEVTGSIGLQNVNERIKLHYGEKYGLKIFSKKGRGTIIRINLPLISWKGCR